MVIAFISYSWDSENHKQWVNGFAERLLLDGVDAILDKWNLCPGDQLPDFMERSVRESDYVIVICTETYKERSNNRSGGVGYEGAIMSGELLTQGNQRKFIPVMRQKPWTDVSPSWLLGKYYIDLSENPYSEAQYYDLLTTLQGTRFNTRKTNIVTPAKENNKPILNKNPKLDPDEFEPIKILGVIVDEVGLPRNDGTRGSGLYDVPFRLSIVPPHEWSVFFVDSWNHPLRYSTMHRPGIASVSSDKVHLNGTTIQEVKDFHRDTLILAVQEANRKYAETIELRKLYEELERKKLENHKKEISDIADEINFDNQ